LTVAGEPFYYLPVAGGRRWFPLCPNGDPPVAGDVCGGTGTTGAGAPPGTFAGLAFQALPDDARCEVVSAHNDHTRPADVVLPAKCFDYPLMFGVASRAILRQVVDDLARKVGSCPQRHVGCDSDLGYWPVHNGHIDCAAVATEHIPLEVRAYTSDGLDRQRLDDVCAVLDAYVSKTPPAAAFPAAAATALGAAAAALYAEGLGGRGGVVTDWGGAFASLPVIGQVVRAAACVDSPSNCFAQWLGGWLVDGLWAELSLIKASIVRPGSISGILAGPGYRQLYGAVGLLALWLLTIVLLLSILSNVLRAHPWGIVQTAGGVLGWGYSWTLALAATLGVVGLADRITGFVGALGSGSIERTVDSFAGAVTSGVPDSAKVGTWVVVALAGIGAVAAAVQWLLTAGRDAAIAVVVLGLPVTLTALAGPESLRSVVRRPAAVLLTLIFAKPVTALMFVLGNVVLADANGLGAAAVGVMILFLACFAPMGLYRLFAAGLVAAETGLSGGRGRAVSAAYAGWHLMSAVGRLRHSYAASRATASAQPAAAGPKPGGSAAGRAAAGAATGPRAALAGLAGGAAPRLLRQAFDAARPGNGDRAGSRRAGSDGRPAAGGSTTPRMTPPRPVPASAPRPGGAGAGGTRPAGLPTAPAAPMPPPRPRLAPPPPPRPRPGSGGAR
jgi:hypothetical protein